MFLIKKTKVYFILQHIGKNNFVTIGMKNGRKRLNQITRKSLLN